MKKQYLFLVIIMILAGCGDVEWMPDAKTGTTTTTTPATTQQSTVTSVKDSTATITAANLIAVEVKRDSIYVDVSIKADLTNNGTQGDVNVYIAGKNAQGLEVFSTILSGSLTGGETKPLTKISLVEISIFPNISKWEIKEVVKY